MCSGKNQSWMLNNFKFPSVLQIFPSLCKKYSAKKNVPWLSCWRIPSSCISFFFLSLFVSANLFLFLSLLLIINFSLYLLPISWFLTSLSFFPSSKLIFTNPVIELLTHWARNGREVKNSCRMVLSGMWASNGGKAFHKL